MGLQDRCLTENSFSVVYMPHSEQNCAVVENNRIRIKYAISLRTETQTALRASRPLLCYPGSAIAGSNRKHMRPTLISASISLNGVIREALFAH